MSAKLDIFKGLAVTTAGAGLSIKEILTNGSLALTCIGAALAILGGLWTYRTARLKHATAKIEHRIKEIELARLERETGSGADH